MKNCDEIKRLYSLYQMGVLGYPGTQASAELLVAMVQLAQKDAKK